MLFSVVAFKYIGILFCFCKTFLVKKMKGLIIFFYTFRYKFQPLKL